MTETRWIASPRLFILEIQDINVGVSEGTSDGAPIWTYYANITPNGLQERKWFSNRSKEELEWI
ncbi:MAG: hypothetical protein VXX55_01880, partial [Planctomycetota bacterium]|nr:hypothetical protein [Planctomycetota bacterium]